MCVVVGGSEYTVRGINSVYVQACSERGGMERRSRRVGEAKRQNGFEAQKKNDWGKIRTARAGVD
jgi:hypothetical protein